MEYVCVCVSVKKWWAVWFGPWRHHAHTPQGPGPCHDTKQTNKRSTVLDRLTITVVLAWGAGQSHDRRLTTHRDRQMTQSHPRGGAWTWCATSRIRLVVAHHIPHQDLYEGYGAPNSAGFFFLTKMTFTVLVAVNPFELRTSPKEPHKILP